MAKKRNLVQKTHQDAMMTHRDGMRALRGPRKPEKGRK